MSYDIQRTLLAELRDEHEALLTKADNLRDFMLRNRGAIVALEYDTLAQQLEAMRAYARALETRLKRMADR